MCDSTDTIGRHWRRAGDDLQVGADEAWADVLRDVLDRHQEPQRRYHVPAHVAAVLHALEQLVGVPDASLVVAAAFHDAVYDPTSASNERRSAALAAECLQPLGVAQSVVDEVQGLILATEAHDASAAEHVEPGIAHAFLDADLSILGASAESYDRYASQIRVEYQHVPDEDFRAGRSRILAAFLDRDRLFFTEAAHERWDLAARRNLRRELGTLQAGSLHPD